MGERIPEVGGWVKVGGSVLAKDDAGPMLAADPAFAPNLFRKDGSGPYPPNRRRPFNADFPSYPQGQRPLAEAGHPLISRPPNTSLPVMVSWPAVSSGAG